MIQINLKSNNITFGANRKLVPLSEYKGVILKLTSQDKEKISIYEKKIAEITIECIKLKNLVKKCTHNHYLYEYYSNRISYLEWCIRDLRTAIFEIKANRMKKQTAEVRKLDTTI